MQLVESGKMCTVSYSKLTKLVILKLRLKLQNSKVIKLNKNDLNFEGSNIKRMRKEN